MASELNPTARSVLRLASRADSANATEANAAETIPNLLQRKILQFLPRSAIGDLLFLLCPADYSGHGALVSHFINQDSPCSANGPLRH